MLLSIIGNYSLVAGLCAGVIIIIFSIKNFQISEHLDTKILSFTFLQFILVFLSFLCLIF